MVREQHIRFLREARPNAPLIMTGGVVEIGETDARLLLLLRHRTGELAASFQTVVAHATAREGRAFPWPDRVLDRAKALAIEVPPEAAARSIGLGPVESRASLARAEALGVRRTGLGAVGIEDCDAFGRMRAEQMMARISAGIPHFFEGRRPGADGLIAWNALWPTPADGYTMLGSVISTSMLNLALQPQGFSIGKEVTYVASINQDPTCIIAKKGGAISTIEEAIAALMSRPLKRED